MDDQNDPISDLERLVKLRDSGALTEEEFESQKAKILQRDKAEENIDLPKDSDDSPKVPELTGEPTASEVLEAIAQEGLAEAANQYGVTLPELDRIRKNLEAERERIREGLEAELARKIGSKVISEIPGEHTLGEVSELLKQRGLAGAADELNIEAAPLDRIRKKYSIGIPMTPTQRRRAKQREQSSVSSEKTSQSPAKGEEIVAPEISEFAQKAIGAAVFVVIVIVIFSLSGGESERSTYKPVEKPVQSWEGYKPKESTSSQEAKRRTEKKKRMAESDAIKFITAIRSAGIDNSLIENARMDARGNFLRITVSNLWHLQQKQIRYQSAQNLWLIWATIHSPDSSDDARIKLLDYNGNEVGGSRVLAGSMIWVQD